MADRSYLHWPFFEPRHREHAAALEAWAERTLGGIGHGDVDAACRELVRRLGEGGWLRHAVDEEGRGLDVRTLCLTRDILARHDGLVDFAFAMQGLGSGAISLFGAPEQKAAWLPKVATGEAVAAFALSEAEAGSDVAALQTTAERDGDGWRLNGSKTWISNGGIADF